MELSIDFPGISHPQTKSEPTMTYIGLNAILGYHFASKVND